MALRQSLQQKLLQKLSPQQIQLMKLLQVPTVELEQRIKQEIEENPALSEGAELDSENNENTNSNENTETNENLDFSITNLDDTIFTLNPINNFPNYKSASQNFFNILFHTYYTLCLITFRHFV